MSVLMGFNTTNADYANYESMYITIGWGTYSGIVSDFGYISLVKLANLVGLNYADFLIFMAVCCVLVLWCGIKQYSQAPNAVLSIFLLYPFLINIIQLRFFLALVIVICLLKYLEERKAVNLVKFCIGLLIAISFHVSAVVFGVLVLFWVKSRLSFLVLALSMFGVFVALSGVFWGLDSATALFHGKLDAYFESNYFTFNKTIRTLSLGGSALALLYCIWVAGIYEKYRYKEVLFYSASTMIVLSTIAIFVSNEFERFARLGYIIIYILFFNVFYSRKVSLANKLALSVLFILTIPGYIFFQYYFRESHGVPFAEAVFQTVIENNALFK